MNLTDLENQAKAIAATVRDYCAKAVAPILTRMEGLENQLTEVKAIVQQPVTFSETEIEKAAELAASKIPVPKDGAPGEKGEDGKSITLEEVQPLILEAVAQIPAPKDGAPGEKGEDGKSFTLEEVEALIEQAYAKRQAPETVTIEQAQKMVDEAVTKAVAAIQLPRDGKDGEDGRDAVALEILPAIDEAKSYPRNTYAIHKGGLFRTFEKSEAMRGWECLVEGVAEINFEQINAREFSVNISKSSGAVVEHKARIPVPVYKGVYREDDTHEQGDMVTWAGAVWHCEEPTTEKPGEGAKGWRLAVKRGRDGKNGTNGRDLVNGMKI